MHESAFIAFIWTLGLTLEITLMDDDCPTSLSRHGGSARLGCGPAARCRRSGGVVKNLTTGGGLLRGKESEGLGELP